MRALVALLVTATTIAASGGGEAGARAPAPQAPESAGGDAWAGGCITQMVRPGDRSRQVKCLKRRLVELGYPLDGKPTFGPETVEAIRHIRQRAGMPASGNVGREVLDYIFSPRRKPIKTWADGCIFSALQRGTTSRQVSCLEDRLSHLGYRVDGKPTFDARTETAVRDMQRRAGHRANGRARATTFDYIFDPSRRPIQTWAKGCILSYLAQGHSGEPVVCLQRRLVRLNLLASADGQFGSRTAEAVRVMERRAGFAADGVAGPNTLTYIFEARLPARIRRGHDELGYRLSPVSQAGPLAPIVPGGSGSGRRIIYSRAHQRAWAVEADGHVVRSWLVSGSVHNNERPGTHHVYSKSRYAGAYTGAPVTLPYMIRYYRTPRGNHIGFHAIPYRSDGSRIMSVWELGTPRSAGCTRQADQDAYFLWNWAPVGTKVIVL